MLLYWGILCKKNLAER